MEGMKLFDGVMTIEVLPDSCLNAIYSNDHPNTNHEIFNGIARKKRGEDYENIFGIYMCGFISAFSNTVVNCELEIRRSELKMEQYHFIWSNSKGEILFEGSGWQTKKNQITLSIRGFSTVS